MTIEERALGGSEFLVWGSREQISRVGKLVSCRAVEPVAALDKWGTRRWKDTGEGCQEHIDVCWCAQEWSEPGTATGRHTQLILGARKELT